MLFEVCQNGEIEVKYDQDSNTINIVAGFKIKPAEKLENGDFLNTTNIVRHLLLRDLRPSFDLVTTKDIYKIKDFLENIRNKPFIELDIFELL